MVVDYGEQAGAGIRHALRACHGLDELLVFEQVTVGEIGKSRRRRRLRRQELASLGRIFPGVDGVFDAVD